jgi:hypothetical protein
LLILMTIKPTRQPAKVAIVQIPVSVNIPFIVSINHPSFLLYIHHNQLLHHNMY